MPDEAKKIKILLVDDDEATRETYAEVFKNSGFEVLEAYDGMAGLDLAITKAPDVVFTGIIMPRMDGYALIEALKKNIATSSLPVFVSSHMGKEADRIKAMELGAKGFVFRDMTPPNKVAEMIKAFFSQSKEFLIEFNGETEDGKRLVSYLRSSTEAKCPQCGRNFVLKLVMTGEGANIYKVDAICPKCG